MHKIKFKRSKEAMKQLANYADNLVLAMVLKSTIKQSFNPALSRYLLNNFMPIVTPV